MKYFLLAIILITSANIKAQTSSTVDMRLAVGDNAPRLQISQWLKHGGFTPFEKGKVYVVDLWATWCVPCIAGMPHLSMLQKKYEAEGLEVIGITNEDSYGNSFANVEKFVHDRDTMMDYNIAWVPPSMNKDSLKGIFVHPWMQQIGSMNLPTAFIIDANGKIAYIGDPHTLDGPLQAVMENHYDLATLRKQYFERLQAEKALDSFTAAIKANKMPEATYQAKRIVTEFGSVKPNTYLILASTISGLSGHISQQLLDIALTAAQRSIMLTQFESPGFFDLLASVYAARKDYFNAICAEKIAISMAESEMKQNQQKNLEKYEKLMQN